MNKFQPPHEIVELATRLVDDELETEQLERLCQIVAEDPGAAAWLVEWLELNAILHQDLASQNQFPLVPTALLPSEPIRLGTARGCSEPAKPAAPTTKSHSLKWRLAIALSAAALLATVYVLGVFTANRETTASTTSADSQSLVTEKTIATIAGGVAAEFDDGLSLGSRVGAGRLRLNRGVAQLVFDKGAVLVLEGPAELYLIDSGTCRLVSGSISADVRPASGEFNVGVGDFSISESNARFGLRTSPRSDTEVHVFGGELNLVDYGSEMTHARRLGEGQAARFDGKDFVTAIDSNPDLFVTRQELARRSRLSEARAQARWVKYSKKWLNDPSAILRYEFGPTPDGIILNSLDAGRHPAKYRLSTPRWISGRWTDKQTMLFDGRTDVLDVADDPALQLRDHFSLAIWFRSRSNSWGPWSRLAGKGHDADRNYGLWVNKDGALMWQVCPDKDPESQDVWDRYSLEAGVLPVGQWCLAVGVLDKDEMRVYVNGELRKTGPAPEKIAQSNDPLTIGFYGDIPHHNSYFCGELDELILLNRALTSDEIVEMYDAGRPEYTPKPGESDPALALPAI